MDWHEVDPEPLFEAVREQTSPADGERMVWALERILSGARIDPGLLDHLAVAAICALAYRDGESPRSVLERLFKRSIPDEHWHREYASLFSPST
jgi:hypothetical protein